MTRDSIETPQLALLVRTDEHLIRDVSIGDLLRSSAATHPTSTALTEGHADSDGRRSWTYQELLAEAEAVAADLLARFEVGERIAVCANNIPEWVLVQFGAALAGLALVTVNPALRARELRHVLADSGAAGLFRLDDYRGYDLGAAIASVRRDLPALREEIRFAEWDAFRHGHDQFATELPEVSGDAIAQIQYTSGTTGAPKGVRLTHRGMVNSAVLSYGRNLALAPGEAFVNTMPLFHTAGSGLATLSIVAAGAHHVLLHSFEPGLFVQLLTEMHSVVLGGVPTMLWAVLNSPDLATVDLPHLRVAFTGGASVDPRLVKEVEARFGVPMLTIYAQTEASPAITMTSMRDSFEQRADTVGRPVPGVDVAVVDPFNGDLLPRSSTGEIVTRGYHVTPGYIGPASLNEDLIDEDGWLHTGDLGSLDRDGYLRVEGRVKEMIIRGGENIYPKEIEDLLSTHPNVSAVAVFGVPDDYWGEQVGAAVILRNKSTATTPAELEALCREHLASHKVPRRWHFVDEFPLTATGKLQRSVLSKSLAED
jgi:fatty-acyl-CoA synthase